MTLAFIQNIGLMELVVLAVLFLGAVGVTMLVVFLAARGARAAGRSNLEARVEALERQLASRHAPQR